MTSKARPTLHSRSSRSSAVDRGRRLSVLLRETTRDRHRSRSGWHRPEPTVGQYLHDTDGASLRNPPGASPTHQSPPDPTRWRPCQAVAVVAVLADVGGADLHAGPQPGRHLCGIRLAHERAERRDLTVGAPVGHTGLDRRVQSAPLAAVQKAAEASGGHHDAVGHERTARRRTSLTLSIAALRHSPHTTSMEGRLRSVPTASVIQTFLSAGSVGGTPNTAKAPP